MCSESRAASSRFLDFDLISNACLSPSPDREFASHWEESVCEIGGGPMVHFHGAAAPCVRDIFYFATVAFVVSSVIVFAPGFSSTL